MASLKRHPRIGISLAASRGNLGALDNNKLMEANFTVHRDALWDLIPLSCGLSTSTDKVHIKCTALWIVGEKGHSCQLADTKHMNAHGRRPSVLV